MKKIIIVLMASVIIISGGCETDGNGGNNGKFVSVKDIVNVREAITSGSHVTGTVIPSNASKKEIIWKIINSEETGAYIAGKDQLRGVSSQGEILFIEGRIIDGIGEGEDFVKEFRIVGNSVGYLRTFKVKFLNDWRREEILIEEVEVTEGQKVFPIDLGTPPAGYEFLGWFRGRLNNKANTNRRLYDFESEVLNDLLLYPMWAKQQYIETEADAKLEKLLKDIHYGYSISWISPSKTFINENGDYIILGHNHISGNITNAAMNIGKYLSEKLRITDGNIIVGANYGIELIGQYLYRNDDSYYYTISKVGNTIFIKRTGGFDAPNPYPFVSSEVISDSEALSLNNIPSNVEYEEDVYSIQSIGNSSLLLLTEEEKKSICMAVYNTGIYELNITSYSPDMIEIGPGGFWNEGKYYYYSAGTNGYFY